MTARCNKKMHHEHQRALHARKEGSALSGIEFRRELRESILILLGGVRKSLWILLYSVCVKHLTVYKSLTGLSWIHLQESLWEWTLAKILTLHCSKPKFHTSHASRPCHAKKIKHRNMWRCPPQTKFVLCHTMKRWFILKQIVQGSS